MKICLVNPPMASKIKENEEWSNYSIHNFQQLGLGYIASALENHGYEVDLIDCPYQRISNAEVISKILESNYDFLGISMFHYNLINAKRIIMKVRKQNEDILIAAGGYVPTLNYSETLLSNPGLNCCFVGEGEETLIKFCDAFSGIGNWKDVEGVAYVSDGQVVVNPVGQAVIDLDSFIFPKRVERKNHSQTLSILTSRGCYGDCSFCSEKSFNIINNSRGMRFRTPENVVDEISELMEKYNPLFININDSNFLGAGNTRKVWLQQFIRHMKERNINTKIRINTRANDILYNCELLKDLKDIGLYSVFIGAESFNQRQLDLYNKKVTVRQNIESVQLLKSIGIKIELGFMMLEPFVELKEINENLMALKDLDVIKHLDYNQYFFSSGCKLYAIKGTSIYNDIENSNIIKANELGYQFIHSDVEAYYQLLERWCNIISPYSKLKYLIDKSILVDNGKWFDIMLNWFADVMQYDLDTIIKLVSYVGVNDKEVDNYIKQRRDEFITINKKYEFVIDRLNQ